VKNAAGALVKADLASVTEAGAAAVAKTIPDDFRVPSPRLPGKNAFRCEL